MRDADGNSRDGCVVHGDVPHLPQEDETVRKRCDHLQQRAISELSEPRDVCVQAAKPYGMGRAAGASRNRSGRLFFF